MRDQDHTRTSPMSVATRAPTRILGLTILWHPERSHIGAQAIGPLGVGTLALCRNAPLFYCLDASQAVLASERVARAPLLLERSAADAVTLTAPASCMTVLVDGALLKGSMQLTASQVARGAVLELGATVVVCLHWMLGLPQAGCGSPIIGVSDAAIGLRELVRQVAGTALPVLLLGETGSGKEVAAQAIHAASDRRGQPWVAVNMATLNESLAAADLFGAEKGAYTGAHEARRGLFAEARGGTLFLDEIGNTPAAIQPMLLRVLESGEYRALGARASLASTARLIAATDQDVRSPAFNQPLLRRLEAFVIHLAPLRERRPDIGLLIAHALDGATRDLAALPAGLVGALCRFDWPGNVRQLLQVVRRLLLVAPDDAGALFETLVAARPLAPTAAAPKSLRRRLNSISDDAVLDAMAAGRWRVLGAARWLGVSRPSMYKLLARHPQIRPVDAIGREELACALAQHGHDLERCAAQLHTPLEALRRHVKS